MLRTVTAASATPVSLAEAKQHLRVRFDDDDDLISSLIAAATLHAQAQTQRRFVKQTVEWVIQCWRPRIMLPIAPVVRSGIVAIEYAPWGGGANLPLDPSLYVAQTVGDTVAVVPHYSAIWPLLDPRAAEPVVLRFEVGTDVKDIPDTVKAAIKLIIGHLYEHRESVVAEVMAELPQGVTSLLMSELW